MMVYVIEQEWKGYGSMKRKPFSVLFLIHVHTSFQNFKCMYPQGSFVIDFDVANNSQSKQFFFNLITMLIYI